MSEAAKHLLDRIAALDTAAAENRRRTEDFERMTHELAAVEGHASDGPVSVVARADGSLAGITFGEAVRTTAPEALSEAVLHAVAAARADAARRQAEVVRGGLGDTVLLDQVLEADERLFGDRRPQEPAPRPRTDDEEFDVVIRATL